MFRFSKTVILTPLAQTDGDQKQISPFVREEVLLVAILIGNRSHFQNADRDKVFEACREYPL